MNAATLTTAVSEAQAIGDEILTILQALPLGVAPEAAVAEKLLDLASKYAQTGIVGWSAAADVPITPESVLALMPDQTPLPDPPSA